MQNRYAGDVGDYIKLGLLRALGANMRLGVAWYLHPDEGHNSDGKHISYLSFPDRWRFLDPALFDALGRLTTEVRSVRSLQYVLPRNTAFADQLLEMGSVIASERCSRRERWFENVIDALQGCDLIFADPDNGIVDDARHRRRQGTFGKQIPISEVLALAHSRPAVVYHHNSRFKGGHDAEVDHWLTMLGGTAFAVRATAYSCRTFFVVNPDKEIRRRAECFCDIWSDHKVRLYARS